MSDQNAADSTPRTEPGVGVPEGRAVEAASAAYYDAMMGQPPHTDGWAGKSEAFKRKVRERMALALSAAALTAAPQPPAVGAGGELSRAALDVLAERRRQVESEGWSAEHDDRHAGGELACAAACYAMPEHLRFQHVGPAFSVRGSLWYRIWPWAMQWWKPSNARRDLVRAGALILAELERFDRAAPPSAPTAPETETSR